MEKDRQLRDIIGHKPGGKLPLPRLLVTARKPSRILKNLFFLILGIFCTAAIAFGFKYQALKQLLLEKGQAIYNQTRVGAEALESFDTKSAKNAFGQLAEEAEALKNKADAWGLNTILDFGGRLVPRLKTISSAIGDAMLLAATADALGDQADELINRAFVWAFNNQGAELLAKLENVEKNLETANNAQQRLKSAAAVWGFAYPSNYLALASKLYQGQTLLKSALNYLNSPAPRHLAILFQNPSEIRPAGGFIGSYADITLNRGGVTKIDVRDIYDPDGQLDARVLPPRPLQSITGFWGARDANWFFDFPTSAKKVLEFLNLSKIYSEQNAVFTAALAINVHLIEDLLRVLGPIKLPEYNLTLDADNFLGNVQREVESGEDKKNGEPKRILKIFTPALLERLANLKPAEKQALGKIFTERIKSKDILAYVEDRALEGYLQSIGMGGEVFAPERAASDDYLAVIHANIAGGKTDAFMTEKINLKSVVDIRGAVVNTLEIERRHTGQDQK